MSFFSMLKMQVQCYTKGFRATCWYLGGLVVHPLCLHFAVLSSCAAQDLSRFMLMFQNSVKFSVLCFPVYCTKHSSHFCWVILWRHPECCVLFETVQQCGVIWSLEIQQRNLRSRVRSKQSKIFPLFCGSKARFVFRLALPVLGFPDMATQR